MHHAPVPPAENRPDPNAAAELHARLQTAGSSLPFTVVNDAAKTAAGHITVDRTRADGGIEGTLHLCMRPKHHRDSSIEKLDGLRAEFTCSAEQRAQLESHLLAGSRMTAEPQHPELIIRLKARDAEKVFEAATITFSNCVPHSGDNSAIHAISLLSERLDSNVLTPLVAGSPMATTDLSWLNIEQARDIELGDIFNIAQKLGLDYGKILGLALTHHPVNFVLDSAFEIVTTANKTRLIPVMAAVDEMWSDADRTRQTLEYLRYGLVTSTPGEIADMIRAVGQERPELIFTPLDWNSYTLPQSAKNAFPRYLAEKLDLPTPLELFSTLSDRMVALADTPDLCMVLPKLTTAQQHTLAARIAVGLDEGQIEADMRILSGFGEASRPLRAMIIEQLGRPAEPGEADYPGRMAALKASLPYCTHLSAKHAAQLLDSEALSPAEFFNNRGAFALTRPELVNLVERIASTNLESLVPAIGAIPDFVWKKNLPSLEPLAMYREELGLPIVEIFRSFTQASAQAQNRLVERVRSFSQEAFSNTPIDAGLVNDPLFHAYVNHVFPNHGDTESYTAIPESHKDQTEDLDLFDFQGRYVINSAQVAAMVLKPKISREPSTLTRIENLLHTADRAMLGSHNGENPFVSAALEILNKNSARGAQSTQPTDLLCDLVDQVERGELRPQQLRRLALQFYLSEVADAPAYRARSIDTCRQAPTPEYAYLFELRDFMTTRLPDNIRLVLSHEEVEPAQQANVARALQAAFEEDLRLLDIEIAKFTPASAEQKKAANLECYVAKNEPSARMRHVAGVCVGGDVEQWEDSSYLQMVFRDPQKNRCEGGALIHYKEDLDRTIMVVSINPSSTYTLGVHQGELFNGIMDALKDFAERNDIDTIACSTDPHIRTNRTGGEFEAALISRIREVGRPLTLSAPFQFSKSPAYRVRELDVLWENR